jgi:hypothetical protein
MFLQPLRTKLTDGHNYWKLHERNKLVSAQQSIANIVTVPSITYTSNAH